MKKFHSLSLSLAMFGLSVLFSTGCGRDAVATNPENAKGRDRDPVGESSLRLESWETRELSDAQVADLGGRSQSASAGPGAGDDCDPLEVTLSVFDFGDFLEARILFHNSNGGTWRGELGLDVADTNTPSTRSVILQNVDAEIGSGGWMVLFVMMSKPETSGLYELRGFGVSGETTVQYGIDGRATP